MVLVHVGNISMSCEIHQEIQCSTRLQCNLIQYCMFGCCLGAHGLCINNGFLRGKNWCCFAQLLTGAILGENPENHDKLGHETSHMVGRTVFEHIN